MAETLQYSIIATDYIIEYVLEAVSEVLYDKFLDTKTIPFTISSSMAILDNLLELTYIRNDPGESEDWKEPLEPPGVVNDTWARGVIPVVKRQKHLVESRPEVAIIDDQVSQTSGQSAFRTSRMRKTVSSLAATIEEKEPELVPLNIEEQEEEDEEDILRQDKERELIKLQAEKEKMEKDKREELEARRQLQRFNEELRNKEFTYDHNGKILVVQRLTNFKGAKQGIQIEYGIPQAMETQPVSQRNLKQPEKRKKLPTKEVQWVKNIKSPQPSFLETLQLSPGVLVIESSRQKVKELESSKPNMMTRRQYIQLTQGESSVLSSANRTQLMSQASQKSFKQDRQNLIDEIPDLETVHIEKQETIQRPILAKAPPIKNELNKITSVQELKTTENLNQVDQFNKKIISSSNWGSNPPRSVPLLPKNRPKKPNMQEMLHIHGDKLHKPKDMPFAKTEELLSAALIRRPRDRPFVDRNLNKLHKAPPSYGRSI